MLWTIGGRTQINRGCLRKGRATWSVVHEKNRRTAFGRFISLLG
jgi:hypothetical protein